MSLKLVVPTFVVFLRVTQIVASPTSRGAIARAYHTRSASNIGSNGNPKIIIIAVLAAVLLILAFFIAREHRKRKQNKRASTQQAKNSSSSIAPGHSAATNYTSIAEQTDNTQTQTREAELGGNNISNRPAARQLCVTRRPSQNSSRSLPSYRERLPDGEIVLVERVERPRVFEHYGDHSEDEEENTPLTIAAASHTQLCGNIASEMPCSALAASTGRAEAGTSYTERWQSQPENPGRGEGTRASVTITQPERANTRVPSTHRIMEDTATATATCGNVPTYDEATAPTVGRPTDLAEFVLPRAM